MSDPNSREFLEQLKHMLRSSVSPAGHRSTAVPATPPDTVYDYAFLPENAEVDGRLDLYLAAASDGPLETSETWFLYWPSGRWGDGARIIHRGGTPLDYRIVLPGNQVKRLPTIAESCNAWTFVHREAPPALPGYIRGPMIQSYPLGGLTQEQRFQLMEVANNQGLRKQVRNRDGTLVDGAALTSREWIHAVLDEARKRPGMVKEEAMKNAFNVIRRELDARWQMR